MAGVVTASYMPTGSISKCSFYLFLYLFNVRSGTCQWDSSDVLFSCGTQQRRTTAQQQHVTLKQEWHRRIFPSDRSDEPSGI